MQISQETFLTPNTLIQLVGLMGQIEDGLEIVPNYVDYLREYFNDGSIGLFTIKLNDEIIAFVHAEQPHPLFPDRGFVTMAAAKKGIRKKHMKNLMAIMEVWLASKGADVWEMQTKRNPSAFARAYGVKLAEFNMMEKQINGRR